MSISADNSPPIDQYTEAIATCRGVLKWILSSFAAVAAVLIAGVQLTSIGQLHGWRLGWSLVAAAVGFGCVFAIILSAVRVLLPTPGTYTSFENGPEFQPLRDFLAKDDAPLRKVSRTAPQLAKDYDAALLEEKEAYERYAADPQDEALKTAYKAATAKRASLFPTLQSLTALGVYLRVRQLFNQTLWLIRVLIPVAAVSAAAFAYLANPPSTAQTTSTGSSAALPTQQSCRFYQGPERVKGVRHRRLQCSTAPQGVRAPVRSAWFAR